MATGNVHLEIIFTEDTPWSRRSKALENLEAEVGYFLRRHEAPELREAYIASREAKVGT